MVTQEIGRRPVEPADSLLPPHTRATNWKANSRTRVVWGLMMLQLSSINSAKHQMVAHTRQQLIGPTRVVGDDDGDAAVELAVLHADQQVVQAVVQLAAGQKHGRCIQQLEGR